MVPFKNVVFTSTPLGESQLSDHSLDNPALGTPVTGLQGYLEFQNPMEAFATYNVMLSNPAILQVEVATAVNIGPDYEIKITSSIGGSGAYNGLYFSVRGRADMHDDGLIADHAKFLLEQKTFPL